MPPAPDPAPTASSGGPAEPPVAPCPAEIRTQRLLLRRWRVSDREPYAAMVASPLVMRFFPGVLSREESDAMIDRLEAGFAEREYGLWALERLDTGDFIGLTGLSPIHPRSPGAGGVEVAWRLAESTWGQGFATEAARASVADGFARLGLDRLWSWTAAINSPSLAVMRRIGMREFARSDHPDLPANSPLSEHVTFVLDRPISGG